MFPQLLPMTPIALTAGSAEHAPAVITGTAIVTLAVAVAVMAGLWLLVEHSVSAAPCAPRRKTRRSPA